MTIKFVFNPLEGKINAYVPEPGPQGDPGAAGPAGSLVMTYPSGDLSYDGIEETITVGESVVFGDALYGNSDGKWWKSDADLESTMPVARMALETKSADESCKTLLIGIARDDSWNWTVGGVSGIIYASTASGEFTQPVPNGTGDQVQVVGFALNADAMFFNPSLTLIEVL